MPTVILFERILWITSSISVTIYMNTRMATMAGEMLMVVSHYLIERLSRKAGHCFLNYHLSCTQSSREHKADYI
jgi:hypothetical protein